MEKEASDLTPLKVGKPKRGSNSRHEFLGSITLLPYLLTFATSAEVVDVDVAARPAHVGERPLDVRAQHLDRERPLALGQGAHPGEDLADGKARAAARRER